MSIKLALSWLKKNAVTISLVVAAILFIVIGILFFWLKIKGYRLSNTIGLLEIANAKNEISHLETRKAVLETKANIKVEQIQDIEQSIKDEQRKVEKAKLEIKGLNNDEVASRLTELGF